MTPILTRLASDIDTALCGTACMDAITASTADLSLVHWRFLAAMLRARQPVSDEVQAVMDPVIAGLDRLGCGEGWPKAEAKAAEAAAWAAWAEAAAVAAAEAAAEADVEVATWAARAADEEAEWAHAAWAAAKAATCAAADAAWAEVATWATWAAAEAAGLSFPHQRDILLRLIEEASE
jgi:hypothetical protein